MNFGMNLGVSLSKRFEHTRQHQRARHRIRSAIALAVLAAAGLSACPPAARYETGRNWQTEQCKGLADGDRRQRCMEDARKGDYDSYEKERSAAAR